MTVFRPATLADLTPLRELVESAFRGDSSRGGWTHEADLLDGPRTDDATLAAIIADPGQTMLLAEGKSGLTGCVLVADKGDGLSSLGMLSVAPGLQAAGLGRWLIERAEALAARTYGASRMEMTVVGVRAELIAWYERRGYRRTGETRPFPAVHRMRPGVTPADLEFAVLERDLRATDAG
ncbi:GNAT family N-acetyltransferase [Glacieibacterium sp.]|uniref:GNAT family N-acetyltransferase n=1 Tax=Glacieibacterium sp. TaxID=2860237 RepID=UPI003AFFEDCA